MFFGSSTVPEITGHNQLIVGLWFRPKFFVGGKSFWDWSGIILCWGYPILRFILFSSLAEQALGQGFCLFQDVFDLDWRFWCLLGLKWYTWHVFLCFKHTFLCAAFIMTLKILRAKLNIWWNWTGSQLGLFCWKALVVVFFHKEVVYHKVMVALVNILIFKLPWKDRIIFNFLSCGYCCCCIILIEL